jgi:HlyD family secretion protein
LPDRKTCFPVVLLAMAGWCGLIMAPQAAERQDAPPLAGVVRETEVRISPEQNGRLAVVQIVAGQQVKRGDLLAELSNPDLAASVAEARAAVLQARTDRFNVLAGVRKEEVNISTENVRIAEANVVLAEQQYARVGELAGRNFSSRQRLDEVANSLSKAEASRAEMQAIQHRNEAGPTAEERMIAEAKLTLATAHAANLEARLAKTRIISPIDATVGVVVASVGEIISPGQAILTLEVPHQRWFSFTIREDSLGGLTIGSSATVVTAKGQRMPGQVTELRPLGEFATWRAARAVGDHDLNSFLLRIEPVGVADGIEPGMTVWLDSAAPAPSR